MHYTTDYLSPLGKLVLTADEKGLTGLWFEAGNYFVPKEPPEYMVLGNSILTEAKKWLDLYFSGQEPDFMPLLHAKGSLFQKTVWKILQEIPYGATTTYGTIAAETAKRLGREKMSAQAVGGAVGHNKISIFIPCHRVVGSTGSLTGYGGGLDKKIYLLTLEGADMKRFFRPVKGMIL